MLRRAPEGRPSIASTQASAFRITLDADGRVTSARALDPRPVQPALLEFVRGLVFAPVATVADGVLRDEKAKDERADALQGGGAGTSVGDRRRDLDALSAGSLIPDAFDAAPAPLYTAVPFGSEPK